MPTPGPWSQIDPPSPPRAPLPPPLGVPPGRGGGRGLLLLVVAAALMIFGLTRLYPDAVTTPQEWLGVAASMGILVMVGARFMTGYASAKRSPMHLAIWIAVIAVLAIGYSYRGELAEVWGRVRSEAMPDVPVTGAKGEMAITRDQDGGFYVTGQADGRPVRFLIDTGASDIVLSPRDAERLGVDLKTLQFGKPVETANGMGFGAAYTLDTLTVGGVTLNQVPVDINKAPMSASLLGMAFLGRMKSFRVEGQHLYIQPKT